jgi:hypothetical protein
MSDRTVAISSQVMTTGTLLCLAARTASMRSARAWLRTCVLGHFRAGMAWF